jgi:hypothetical protein
LRYANADSRLKPPIIPPIRSRCEDVHDAQLRRGVPQQYGGVFGVVQFARGVRGVVLLLLVLPLPICIAVALPVSQPIPFAVPCRPHKLNLLPAIFPITLALAVALLPGP